MDFQRWSGFSTLRVYRDKSGVVFVATATEVSVKTSRKNLMRVFCGCGAAICAIGLAPAGVPAGPKSFEMLPSDARGPRLFAEGVISTPGDEAGGEFSSDGTEFYFTVLNPATAGSRIGLLCVSRWSSGKWGAPEVLAFSGKSLDFSPHLSPDGKTMYFASLRPLADSKVRAIRIWRVEKTEHGWGEPRALPAPVNPAEGGGNWGASVTRDGTLYFASDRDSGHLQIFRARAEGNGGYGAPEKLGPEINSEFNDFEPFVNPDETMLFFVSAGEGGPPFRRRPDTLCEGGFPYSRGDIYFSHRVNGKWTQAQHLEHGVNTVADEGAPTLTPDGKFLIFASERSPFVVPMPQPITMKEFDRLVHSTLNGHWNIFSMPLAGLKLGDEGGRP